MTLTLSMSFSWATAMGSSLRPAVWLAIMNELSASSVMAGSATP